MRGAEPAGPDLAHLLVLRRPSWQQHANCTGQTDPCFAEDGEPPAERHRDKGPATRADDGEAERLWAWACERAGVPIDLPPNPPD